MQQRGNLTRPQLHQSLRKPDPVAEPPHHATPTAIDAAKNTSRVSEHNEKHDLQAQINDLRTKLQQLRLEVQKYGDIVVESGTRMKTHAELPTRAMLAKHADFQKRLDSLRRATAVILQAIGRPPRAHLRQRCQTESLLQALNQLQHHFDDAAETAGVLARIQRLRLRMKTEDSLIAPIQMECAELQRVIDRGATDTRLSAIAKGIHPLAELLRLVESIETLPDDEFEHLRQAVTKAYGSAVARLVLRGQLYVEDIANHSSTAPRAPDVSPEPAAPPSSEKDSLSHQHSGNPASVATDGVISDKTTTVPAPDSHGAAPLPTNIPPPDNTEPVTAHTTNPATTEAPDANTHA